MNLKLAINDNINQVDEFNIMIFCIISYIMSGMFKCSEKITILPKEIDREGVC